MLASFDKRCSAQFVRALQCHSTRGAPHHAKCEVEDLRFFLCAASELCTAAKSGSKGDLRGCLQVHAGDHVQCRSQFVEVHRSCLAKHFQSRPRIIEILSKLHADGGDLDDSTQKARTTIQVGEEVCPLMHDALQPFSSCSSSEMRGFWPRVLGRGQQAPCLCNDRPEAVHAGLLFGEYCERAEPPPDRACRD
eukprot:gnl/Hemi2/23901_TR8024_c0_g1_i2.p1 gnl/Hemi2/23901_TR8024_c0_g1~~gnl/Hemi2/23901_TR8024_c0_g1_i2.p1  ORF type:complete len:193 (+),score=31.41 gnl/Hemi2/23901_TR8024_c0_g1_i2:74-652(+)